MTSTFKKIQSALLSLATLSAPSFSAIGLGVLMLIELFVADSFFIWSGRLLGAFYLVWNFAVGTQLYGKLKDKPKKRYYAFLIALGVTIAVQIILLITQRLYYSEYQFGQQPNPDVMQLTFYLSYLNMIASLYLPYFLTIVLRQHETGRAKMEWKTYAGFMFIFLVIWDIHPRLHQVFFPKRVAPTYQPRTKKLASIIFFIYLILYFVAAMSMTWRIMSQYREDYESTRYNSLRD